MRIVGVNRFLLVGFVASFVLLAPVFGMEPEEQEINVAKLCARIQIIQEGVKSGAVDFDRLRIACENIPESIGAVVAFLRSPENQEVLDNQREVVAELMDIQRVVAAFLVSDGNCASVYQQDVANGLARFVKILMLVESQSMMVQPMPPTVAAHGRPRTCCGVLKEIAISLAIVVPLTAVLVWLGFHCIDFSSWDSNDNDFII